ncbi:hypothetical protein [Enterovibrio coralii]|uniref:Uncharacterized protein n=1 Tax=Enterovibrio coralii TaxID=294935 RepID=A0A135I4T4_9GAMM|nr:hypothetical protein [Enterovibrio coralii]KXF80438.1 hypothetical protein ATN88_22045 [Enterovibrio coralii]
MATPVISVRPKAIARRNEHPLKWTDKKGHCRVQHQLLDVFTDMTKRLRLGRESRLYVQEKHCAREYETRLLSLYEMARHAEHTSLDESAPRRYAASPTSRRE